VVRVVPELRPAGTRRWDMPDICPSCGEPVVRVEGEADTYCVNGACPAQLVRHVEHFVSRGAMDVEGFGSRLAAQLVDAGLLGDVADVYGLGAEDLADLEGFAEKRIANLLAAIDAARDRPLARLLVALGIRHVGGVVAAEVARAFGSLEAVAQADREALEAVPGVGPEIAASIDEWFAIPANGRLVARLRAAGVRLADEPPAGGGPDPSRRPLDGRRLVLTGTLAGLTRGEARALIEAAGGRVVGGVSARTDYVVVGERPGSKLARARDLGVPELDEAGLRALVGAGT
jgi:DNA ligase (NAD+)